MEAVGRLTGGIAHDFNNILGTIVGSVDLLLERLDPQSESTELAQEALDSALRGAELTKRLLAFSRRQPLQPDIIDLNEALSGMMRLVRRAVGETVDVTIVPGNDLWPALADKAQVEEAVLNLTINARDAMPAGGRLVIETANVHLDEDYAAHHVEVTPGDYAMLAVTDSGKGMPPEVAEKAFEPFFTTKEVGKGTGLGLSMVYGFVKQSGGHLKIYSELGHGTTVRLYLPRAGQPGEAPAREEEKIEHPKGRETILVVEDEARLRAVATRILRDLGYTVLEAKNGPEALALLDDGQSVDLLFTDIVMPDGMNGRDLARAARERRQALKVLLTSGYSETFVRNGGEAYPPLLSKPYRKEQLARRIREILDRQGSPENE
jgi:CheY-like chemotaxis protein